MPKPSFFLKTRFLPCTNPTLPPSRFLVFPFSRFPSSRFPVFPSSRLPVFSSSRLPVFPFSRLPVFPSSRLPFSRLPVFRFPVFPSSRFPVFPSSRFPVFSSSCLHWPQATSHWPLSLPGTAHTQRRMMPDVQILAEQDKRGKRRQITSVPNFADKSAHRNRLLRTMRPTLLLDPSKPRRMLDRRRRLHQRSGVDVKVRAAVEKLKKRIRRSRLRMRCSNGKTRAQSPFTLTLVGVRNSSSIRSPISGASAIHVLKTENRAFVRQHFRLRRVNCAGRLLRSRRQTFHAIKAGQRPRSPRKPIRRCPTSLKRKPSTAAG